VFEKSVREPPFAAGLNKNSSCYGLYLQPIWDFKDESSPPLPLLKKFAEAYFALPVAMLPQSNPAQKRFSPRTNETGK
jgi:hypothetical protein